MYLKVGNILFHILQYLSLIHIFKNIESSFRQIRLFGIVFLSLCAVVTVWSVWNSYRFAEKQREKIYVLSVLKSVLNKKRTVADFQFCFCMA